MTDSPKMPIVNIAEAPLREQKHGHSFDARYGRVGPMLGLSKIGVSVTVVPPGKRAFPFHRHHVADEAFFIVSGSGEYRYGEEKLPVKPGDIIAAPAGGKAHQLINSGKEELRYLAVSTVGSVDILEYPDSGKVAMAAGIKNADFKTATYVGTGHLQKADYWDGED